MVKNEGKNSRHPFIYFLILMKIVGLLAGVFAGISFILSLIGSGEALGDNSDELNLWATFGLSFYGGAFCVTIVLIEFRFKPVMDNFQIVQKWWGRGLFYIFVGLLIFAVRINAIARLVDADPETIENMIIASGLALIVCGLIYMIMEVLCLRSKAISLRKTEGTDTMV